MKTCWRCCCNFFPGPYHLPADKPGSKKILIFLCWKFSGKISGLADLKNFDSENIFQIFSNLLPTSCATSPPVGDGAQCDASSIPDQLFKSWNYSGNSEESQPGGAHAAGAESGWSIRTMRMSPRERQRSRHGPGTCHSPTVHQTRRRRRIPRILQREISLLRRKTTGSKQGFFSLNGYIGRSIVRSASQ